jgi:hypothetical protein
LQVIDFLTLLQNRPKQKTVILEKQSNVQKKVQRCRMRNNYDILIFKNAINKMIPNGIYLTTYF